MDETPARVVHVTTFGVQQGDPVGHRPVRQVEIIGEKVVPAVADV
jgi:hypothetical protein